MIVKNINKLFFIFLLFVSLYAVAEEDFIDFESDRWEHVSSKVVQYLGRNCLMGYAFIKDLEFENGIIEFDISVSRDRSYPGVFFRMQENGDCEHLYIRPHRTKFYNDAIQYTPSINNITGWQLYNGLGYTAGIEIPFDEWIHIRLEVLGKRARIYIDNNKNPALEINDLKNGLSKGTIALYGPMDGTAYFSNFYYKIDNSLRFDIPPIIDEPPGIISKWYLSEPLRISQIDIEEYPGEEYLSKMKWCSVESEHSGLVNIARYVSRTGIEPDAVFAKTIIHSDVEKTMELVFGYSDVISVFLNGNLLFTGYSAYQSRDPSFLGIIGLFDTIYLPLKKGENELLLVIAESFGGWGFICQDGEAHFENEDVEKAWETTNDFKIPESVVYDKERDVIYVSNYDRYNLSRNEGMQFISKVSVNGKIEDLNWITGLFNPTGVEILNNRLFVVERGGLVEIDIDSAKIVNRFPVSNSGFLNDLAIDGSGNIYISDSRENVIYRFKNGEFEEWLKGDDIDNPNGLHIYKNSLIVGNNGDNCLKIVDLNTKEIMKIANLGSGTIDGIKTDKDGNYIVSHWEGRVYKITPRGQVTKLIDTSVQGTFSADIEYVDVRDMIVIPNFINNRVTTYKIKE